MDKKAKLPLWAIILIIVGAVFVLLIIAASLFIMGSLSYYYHESEILTPRRAVINPPFYLNESSVNTKGISLNIMNNIGENIEIKEIEISGCGKLKQETLISPGELNLFEILCTLTKGELFEGDIIIRYSEVNSLVVQTSKGYVSENVN